ncbi:RING-H2 finger protein ATL13 [Morus notabilis]|uniref:RING-type E3 ubiquitin transferase n=1 Tax=Morus notabilis TaxID=981085 RepID=W9RK48_9ROSA|nr:RING-H2 finger protein ATL13 [Morus notabilis]EXB94924.1 RING-H2 finger protein ATL13 [Morus notabilis]
MASSLLQTKEKPFLSPTEQQSYFISQPPPSPPQESFNFNTKVSPSILLIIVILAIIFFVSGLLHLLVRFLLRPPNRDRDDLESVSALQGQLQQLFHLHDAGVDQSFIDNLPVFHYKAIIGLKNPFDCAVCLCEFDPDDKLRLLPKCSHAFHMECIDTWLLSHSTCPLCRASLLQDFSPNDNFSPVVLVLESGSESSREIAVENGGEVEQEISPVDEGEKEESNPTAVVECKEKEKVVTVKLGKFRNVDNGEGSSSIANDSSNVDSRRCFSMGSFAYVMDESSDLRVPIRTPLKKSSNKKASLPSKPGLSRAAISECDCESRREFEFSSVNSLMNARVSKTESFSSSKLSDSRNPRDCSRRAFSFRFPMQRSSNGVAGEDLKGKNEKFPRRTVSEIGAGRWENERTELGFEEEENRSCCNSLDSQSNPPSFARRTLLWLMGRQNKVVHSSFDAPNP